MFAFTDIMQIRLARFPEDSAELKAAIAEYLAWLSLDLSARGLAREMEKFDQLFTLPSGLFLIACTDAGIAACVGLLRHSDDVAEVKRLYVRPAYRGQHLGRTLLEALIGHAGRLGFARLILDAALPTIKAQRLYESIGFTRTEPYYANPSAGTRFYALALRASADVTAPL